MKYLLILFLQIIISSTASAGINWIFSELFSRSPPVAPECKTEPFVDCFTKGTHTTSKQCKEHGCHWCPKTTAGQPWCVTGQPVPEICSTEPTSPCFHTGAEVTKELCDRANCFWCPNKNDRPWCVKETVFNITLGDDANNSTCEMGSIPRKGQSDQCCKLTSDSTCGRVSGRGRIVGGSDSLAGAWPWLIYFIPYEGATCGAVLISKRFALTAGHCVYRGYPKNMLLRFGIFNTENPQRKTITSAKVKKYHLHQKFQYYPRLVKDIALIEFTESVVFSDDIQPICLPRGEKPPIGSKCFITGWGSLFYGGHSSPILQEASVFILEDDVCADAYGETYSSKKMICAGHMDGSADSCQGDSGGPLMCQRCSSCQWYLAGLVSYGRGCGEAGFPGIYTRVSGFELWLKGLGVRTKSPSISC